MKTSLFLAVTTIAPLIQDAIGFSTTPIKMPATIMKPSAKSLHYSMPGAEPQEASAIPPPPVFSKYFQLEEKEDNEDSTTELFLWGNGDVHVGETDGPPPIRASGHWTQDGNKFEMVIKRTFDAGKDGTDMGNFSFSVERGFVGTVSSIGPATLIEGAMHVKVSKTCLHQ